MSWETLFSLTNILALGGWALLIFAPRAPLTFSAITYLGGGLLCLIYVVGLGGLLSGLIDPGGPNVPLTDYSVAGLQASMFKNPGGTVIGWTHYLAFDLFIGMWIARDADAKGFGRIWQAPILLLTFLVGPLGLLIWLALREPAARRAQPRRKK